MLNPKAPVLSGLARVMSEEGGDGAPGEEYCPASVLVTGGAGFIASHVVLRLVARYPDAKVRPRRRPVPSPAPAPPHGVARPLARSGRDTRAAGRGGQAGCRVGGHPRDGGLSVRGCRGADCCPGQAGLLRVSEQLEGRQGQAQFQGAAPVPSKRPAVFQARR